MREPVLVEDKAIVEQLGRHRCPSFPARIDLPPSGRHSSPPGF
jgi:hypothetical protein